MKPLIVATTVGVLFLQPAFAKDFDIRGFSEVSAAAGITVTVVAGEDFSVVGEARRGNIRRLRISKNGDRLVIDRKTSWSMINWFRNDQFDVDVTMPLITGASASSGSSMSVDADGAESFYASASSGANLSVSDIAGGPVELDASSGASLSAIGTCSVVKAEASSGALLSASELECVQAFIEASSGASMGVRASQLVAGKVSSGATLSVSGDPAEKDVSTSSGGSVSN